MTVYARVITIGKNSDIPKVVRLPVGVGVDGAAVRCPVTIRGDESLCPKCEGWGHDEYDDECGRCNGRGIIHETSLTGFRCFGPVEKGRPVAGPSAGRPTTPGVVPAALAANVSRQLVPERTQNTVLRRCSALIASRRPAPGNPPACGAGHFTDVAVDVVTVVAGLVVFGGLAWFALVLA